MVPAAAGRGLRAGRAHRRREERLHPHDLPRPRPAGAITALRASRAISGPRRRAGCATSTASPARPVATLSADMRYARPVLRDRGPAGRGLAARRTAPARIADAFHRRHRALYDFDDPKAPVQVVNLRLVIAGTTERPVWPRARWPTTRPQAGAGGRGLARRRAPPRASLLRANLRHGHAIAGPAIVAQEDTTVVHPGRLRRHRGRASQPASRRGGLTPWSTR